MPASMISRFEESIDSGTGLIGASSSTSQRIADEPAHRRGLLVELERHLVDVDVEEASAGLDLAEREGAQVGDRHLGVRAFLHRLPDRGAHVLDAALLVLLGALLDLGDRQLAACAVLVGEGDRLAPLLVHADAWRVAADHARGVDVLADDREAHRPGSPSAGAR